MTVCGRPGPPRVTWLREEFEQLALELRDRSREVFERDGCHIPISFLFATRHPESGRPHAHVMPILSDWDSDEEKDLFVHALGLVAHRLQAVGLVSIMEMWSSFVDIEGLSDEEALERVRQAPRPHDAPDRREALFVMVEHSRFGCRAYQAEILRDSRGKPSLAPWQEPSGKLGGRFMRILPEVS